MGIEKNEDTMYLLRHGFSLIRVDRGHLWYIEGTEYTRGLSLHHVYCRKTVVVHLLCHSAGIFVLQACNTACSLRKKAMESFLYFNFLLNMHATKTITHCAGISCTAVLLLPCKKAM